MNLRSPIAAMLWEQWRLTRVEGAQRLALGLAGGSAALSLLDADKGAIAAFWILIVLHGMVVWLSIAKLNGGRFVDGYKPGFPLYLAYVRPIPTAAFVGVTLAYDAVAGAALYVASAALLGFAFGQPLPLFSVVPWIVAFHLAYACIQYSTPNRAVQWGGSFVIHMPLFLLLMHRVASPLQVEFSFIENISFVLIGIASFALTVVGVGRQRCGETTSPASPSTRGRFEYPDWLISLFRFPCPTSSAPRAQLWFELKCSGLPVLALGLALAALIFLLFAVSIIAPPVRAIAVSAPVFFMLPFVFILGGNAFGIRRRQGRTYVSAFEAVQPYGTAQLASIKVLVRTICVLASLTAIATSIWLSSSLVSAWGTWVVQDGKDAVPGLLDLRSQIGDAMWGQSRYAFAALAVTLVVIATIVVWLAAREALRARYPRLLLVAEWLPVACGLAMVVLALAGRNEIVSMPLVRAIIGTLGLIALAGIVCATIYLLRSGIAARAMTFRYAFGVLVITSVFAAAWVTVLPMFGVQLAGMPWAALVWMLWPMPLLLMLGILAPWSLNRIRHT